MYPLIAQLTGDGSKDTSAAGVLIAGVDKNGSVLVEADVGPSARRTGLTVRTTTALTTSPFLDTAAGSGLCGRSKL